MAPLDYVTGAFLKSTSAYNAIAPGGAGKDFAETEFYACSASALNICVLSGDAQVALKAYPKDLTMFLLSYVATSSPPTSDQFARALSSCPVSHVLLMLEACARAIQYSPRSAALSM